MSSSKITQSQLVSIEGNIGGGKSTLLKKCVKNIQITKT